MPLAKAVKTFRGRYGMIRAGETFNCEPKYFAQLALKGFAVPAQERADPKPEKNRSIPEAPNKAGAPDPGKVPAAPGPGGTETAPNSATAGDTSQTSADPPAPSGTERRRGAGRPLTSRSLRRDLPSSKRTSKPSAAGGSNLENPDNPPAE